MLREYLISLGKLAGMPSRTLPGLGDTADDVLADAGLMGRAGMLEEAPADALPYHGRNSGGLSQAAGESAAAYLAYLRQRWPVNGGRGTVPGLQAQLARLGFPSSEVWTELDLKLTGYVGAFGGTQGAFFVLLRKPHAILPAALKDWNDGQLWDGSTTWGGTTATWAQISEILATIRRWKPATTSCRFVIIELDAAAPLVLGVAAEAKTTGVAETLLSAWGAGPGDALWAVGAAGTILWWESGSWTADTSGVATELRAVTGGTDGLRWAVGAGGTALVSQDPTLGVFVGWTPVPVDGGVALRAVWSHDDLNTWAVGDGGAVRRYNVGTANFDTAASATAADLYGIWGADLDQLWAVGQGGVIMRWEPASWTVIPSGTTANLRAVWGSSRSDVWAVGAGGIILHWNGAAWSAVASGTTADLLSVSGTGPNNVIVTSTAGPLRWDGLSWRALPAPAGSYRAVWAAGTQLLWAVGAAGLSVRWGAADFSGAGLVVPCGETWEVNPATGGRVEFYNYSYLRERVS